MEHAAAVTRIPAPLLAWHDPTARDLAWRSTSDPWAVLVSEVMAQQTQAARAAAAWTRFMTALPTAAACAAAPVGDVIALWGGLGYNRRAVNLHRCAQAVVADHGGVLPDDLDALLALPGVGPYTARAVLAFAFGRDVVGVDTNVARVLARVAGAPLSRTLAQALADHVARGRGPQLGAALMDLGATTCTARRPACPTCPLQAVCTWAGGPGADPAAAGAHRPRSQGTFAGSARQARGRLVAALRAGWLDHDEALALAGQRGAALLEALIAEGLAERTPHGFALPGQEGRTPDRTATQATDEQDGTG